MDNLSESLGGHITTDSALEKQQHLSQAYQSLKHAFEHNSLLEVELIEYTSGGFKAHYQNIPLFLPFTNYTFRRNSLSEEELRSALGSKISVKVKEYTEDEFGKVIKISHKEVLEDSKWDSLSIGTIVTAKVSAIVPGKGAVLELSNGLESFVPISYISRGRVDNISDFLAIGAEVKGSIVDLDRSKRRLIVSLKHVLSDSVNSFFDTHSVGDRVSGVVESVTSGVVNFVLSSGVYGVLRSREVLWTLRHVVLSERFEIGKSYDLEIIQLDRDNCRIDLSYKRTQPDNWGEIADKYKPGLTYSAVVEFIPPNGRGAELTLNNEIDVFMPKPRAVALYDGNKPNFKPKDVIQVKVFNKDPERHSMLVESAIKQERSFAEGGRSGSVSVPVAPQKAKSNSYTLADLLSDKSKMALKK